MKVVFICHEATRTGVPLLLLRLVQWLREEHGVSSFIILLNDGPLKCEFQKEAEVFQWSTRFKSISSVRWGRRISEYCRYLYCRFTQRLWLRRSLKEFNPEMVYLNTVATVRFFHRERMLFGKLKCILHCHEMPFTIHKYLGTDSSHFLSSFDKVVVVNSIAETFLSRIGVSPTKLLRVTEYLPHLSYNCDLRNSNMQRLRVLGSGLGSWRKGLDLFILCAFYFKKLYRLPFVFTWVGHVSPLSIKQHLEELKIMGIDDVVEFAGEVENISEYLADADVFLLTSREDSYPIVMLEAAWFKKPVIYFDNTGGASEFVDDCELAVAPFDVQMMADKLYRLALSNERRKMKGEALKSKVMNHSVDVVGNRILNFISK